ncbi:hypothetical protein ACFXTH_025342 [Malus domestica]
MAGIVKLPGAFTVTPHKVSVCILLQIYASPSQISVPFPFSTVDQHNLAATAHSSGIFCAYAAIFHHTASFDFECTATSNP